MRCLYETLQLNPHADAAVVKSAYRTLAHKYHPDHHPGDAHAESMMKQINHAYDVLSNTEKRAEYDLQQGFSPLALVDFVDTDSRETKPQQHSAHHDTSLHQQPHHHHHHQPKARLSLMQSPWLLRVIIFVAAAIFSVMAAAKWIMLSDPRMAPLPAKAPLELKLRLDENPVPTAEK